MKYISYILAFALLSACGHTGYDDVPIAYDQAVDEIAIEYCYSCGRYDDWCIDRVTEELEHEIGDTISGQDLSTCVAYMECGQLPEPCRP